MKNYKLLWLWINNDLENLGLDGCTVNRYLLIACQGKKIRASSYKILNLMGNNWLVNVSSSVNVAMHLYIMQELYWTGVCTQWGTGCLISHSQEVCVHTWWVSWTSDQVSWSDPSAQTWSISKSAPQGLWTSACIYQLIMLIFRIFMHFNFAT